MKSSMLQLRWTRTLGVLLLSSVFAACRPTPPETPPAPEPPAPEVGVVSDAAVTTAEPVIEADSAVASVASEPEVSKMMLARATSSKLGVPVDLRYQFDAAVEEGRPVTLHLAAVPRVAGSNLTVSIQESAGIDAAAAPISAQKAAVSTAYRQQLSVTRHAGAPEELRVLVTMDVGEGEAFGYFSVPMGSAPAR